MQKILNDCYPYLKDQGSLGNLLANYGDGNSVNTWGNPTTKKLVDDAKAYGQQLAAQVNAGGSGGLEAKPIGVDCFQFTQIPAKGEFSTSYEVKTATGETITDFSILTPNGIVSPNDDLSKYIKEGDVCRIISNEAGKTVGFSKVNASSSSETMNGRMMICASANGRAQARIMAFGNKRPQDNTTSTESGIPPEDDNPPVIVVEKYDAFSGGKLNGVTLQADIDYGYYSKTGEGNNFTIYFGDLLASDALLKAELSNPYMNNAAKLLDPIYETGIDLSQGTLSQYVYNELVKNLMPKVTGSPTYQMWVAHVAACRCSHGTQHGSRNLLLCKLWR